MINKYFLSKSAFFFGSTALLLGGILLLLINEVKAAPVSYYFNNAVNTSPATLGNYWYDSAHTDPALEVPDPTANAVSVAAGATYTGNATFIDFATNAGTVTGTALFVGDSSENTGTVNGVKTRKYTSATTTTRNFTTGGAWTVLADGAAVNVSGATFDGTTTFTTANGGSFTYISLYTSYVYGNTVTLKYDTTLDTDSVPLAGDYVITVNGITRSITNVSISGTSVVLTLDSAVSASDLIRATYVPGASPVQRLQGNDAPAFSDQVILYTITTGSNPQYPSVLGFKLYMANASDDSVSVLDSVTDTISATISVGSGPSFSAAIGNRVYISNTTAGTVSVINTDTNAVVETIPDVTLEYAAVVGTKIYTPYAGEISVIDTETNDVTVIDVGDSPKYPTSIGTKVYVRNKSSDDVSVIDTATDTVTATISVGSSPQYAKAVGTKLYVSNSNDDTVSVINTTTNLVTATITVGSNPVFMTAVGTKLYVENTNAGTISVINTNTDTVTTTIPVTLSGFYSLVIGNNLYVPANPISVINTLTDTISTTIPVGTESYYSSIIGNKYYLNHFSGDGVSVFDTENTAAQIPNLVSFTTSRSNGTYGVGEAIKVTANFGRDILEGSQMNVLLTNGDYFSLINTVDNTLSGSYPIGPGDETPDFGVRSIVSANVTDSTGVYQRTSYSMPASVGSFEAENSLISRNIGDLKNIEIGDYLSIDVGDNPYQISSPVTVDGVQYVYVANQGSADVSVLRLDSNMVVAEIGVGEEPYGLTVATVDGVQYIYVANTNSHTVSVIDTETNTVTDTISVGIKPYYATTVGSDVYVTNGASNTVSVIDTETNTVTDTISVGAYPRGIKAYGTNLYVANYGDPNYSGGNYISVINSTTNTVTDAIILPAGSSGPRGVTVLGTKVYVTNYRSNNVSVINTATNTVTATISVGAGPRGIVGYGTNIYVENFDDGTVSVIDTNTNTVTATIDVGHSPSGMSVVGNYIYVSNFQDGLVRILDTNTNTLKFVETVVIGSGTSGGGGGGANLNYRDQAPGFQDVVTSTIDSTTATPTKTCSAFVSLMKRGVRGGEVKSLQERLNELEFNSGIPDGIFGPLTEKAVKGFQTAKNLIADGIVGPITRGVLNNICS